MDINLNEKQKLVVRYMAEVYKRREVFVLRGSAGSGKEMPNSVPILTPDGWQPMGSIQVGQQVIGKDGNPTTVSGVYPQGLKDVYLLTFSDGSTTRCGLDHLWTVATQKKRKDGSSNWQTKSLREILNEGYIQEFNKKNPFKWRLPAFEGLKGGKPFPAAYALGYVLGNGSFGKGQLHVSYHVKYREDLKTLLTSSLGLPTNTRHTSEQGLQSSYSWSGIDPEILKYRDKNMKSETKALIPEHDYLSWDFNSRLELLKGLMDSDGALNNSENSAKGSKASFSTTSPYLRDLLTNLVRSLGGRCAKPCYDNRTYYKSGFCCKVSFRLKCNPFKLRQAEYVQGKFSMEVKLTSVQKLETQEYSTCISVLAQDSLYVCENFKVTHNTFALLQGLLNLQQNHSADLPTICVAVPNHSVADLWRDNLLELGLGEVQVKTVHSVMKLFPGVENDGTRTLVSFEDLSQGKSILPFQLLIIDEAFMLNKQLIQTIYSHGYLGVIFAGDPDQTLPIGESISHLNEITDVAFDLTLDQNMRQKDQLLKAIVEEVKEKALGYRPDLMNERDFDRLFFKTAMADRKNTLFLAYRNRTTKRMSNMLRSMEGVVDLDFVEVGEIIKVKSVMVGKKLIVPAESLVEVLSTNPERNSFKIGFNSSTLDVMIDREGAQENLLIKAKLKNDKKTWAEYYKLCDSFVSFCHPCVSTVHSVQGQSIKNVFIDWKDLANCIQDPSLAYVAASRCSENIYFK